MTTIFDLGPLVCKRQFEGHWPFLKYLVSRNPKVLTTSLPHLEILSMFIRTSHDFFSPKVILPLLFIIIVASSWLSGTLGKIGNDNDDIMRLLQIRDFLQGQNWFDLHQYRLGPTEGTLMHWSRIPDIPIILTISFFDLFLPYEIAEKLGLSLWPPITATLLAYGVYKSCLYLAGERAAIIGMMITGFFTLVLNRFTPGAIDHHNLQVTLLILSVAALLYPEKSVKSYAAGAMFIGLAFAIAAEIYVLGGVICGFVALQWVWKGKLIQAPTIAFALVFSLTILGAFLATIPKSAYLNVYCDSLSMISLSGALVGGFGLAFIALLISSRNGVIRSIALTILAFACLLLFIFQAPACLSNPLDALPENVKTLWLDNITETKPLVSNASDLLGDAMPILVLSVIGLFVCMQKARKKVGGERFLLMGALILLGLLMSLYQSRFALFVKIIALIPMAILVDQLLGNPKETRLRNRENNPPLKFVILVYLFTFISIAVMFGDALSQSQPSQQAKTQNMKPEGMAACYSADLFGYLKTLPGQRMLVTESFAPYLLSATDHSSLTGNYHRNATGISDAIAIWTSPSEISEKILRQQNIHLIHFCSVSLEYEDLLKQNSDGLINRLMAKDIPEYLSLVTELEDGKVQIFRINPI